MPARSVLVPSAIRLGRAAANEHIYICWNNWQEGQPTVSECTLVSNNGFGGKWWRGASGYIVSSHVRENESAGLYIVGEGTRPRVEACEFEANRGIGLCVARCMDGFVHTNKNVYRRHARSLLLTFVRRVDRPWRGVLSVRLCRTCTRPSCSQLRFLFVFLQFALVEKVCVGFSCGHVQCKRPTPACVLRFQSHQVMHSSRCH